MENTNFNTSFSAQITAQDAIRKISDVPQWWGVSFTGSAAKQNDTFTVKMGGDSFFNVVVSELIPAQKVVWLVTDCNMPWYTDKKEWTNTKMIFEANELNGITELTFTHEGLTPQRECYKDCGPGWTHWIKTSLFSYLTTGKGVFRAPTK